MSRLAVILMILSFGIQAFGQVRLHTLVIKSKEVYELKGSDILVVDTLIMMDSSTLVLNKLKKDNFIHAKKVVFYRGSLIEGKGVAGLPGRNGRAGTSSSSPCSDGGSGTKGTDGTDGGSGINLFMSFNDIVLHGVPVIDVSGGDAGDGGDGGTGGGGGSGTRLCVGGNGGSGGPGSNGGNGGGGGAITFHATSIPELRSMLGEQIIIKNFGGNLGYAGDGGGGGFAGLNPTGKNSLDGKPGKKGLKGKSGVAGKTGAIHFQSK
ncbi:MAG: hypothetical protein JNK10_09970 [Cyclobacteriaceae bacterium]|nr:hypothetical protein [Cyclobacteriaceae bacterium]